MRRALIALAVAALPLVALADDSPAMRETIVQSHILPRFAALADRSGELALAARDDCDPTSPSLRKAYGAAFDAWVSASHLRFGPTEVEDRAFALAFWPDSRGATPKSLKALITTQDPVVETADGYAEVSIAARGFYALEFLLFDEAISAAGQSSYRCTLIQTVTADIAATTFAIGQSWTDDYAARLLYPTADGTYRSENEARQELFKALSTGLQFASETRLGRPLGTFDKPRPTRAEAWRSGRSAHHVSLSLLALRDLAALLAAGNAALAQELDAAFDHALTKLAALDDPIFAGVADVQSRFKVEVVQQSVDAVRTIVRDELGPELGVAAGFNSLDGD